MLTVFGIPKAFRGNTAIQQRNAVGSWARLGGEVLLFGDDDGTAEAAVEVGARHVPRVARSPAGTPLVGPLFEDAQRLARHDLLGYVNADIVLVDDFVPALRAVASNLDRFLMVGRRTNVRLREPLDFGNGWEARARALAARGRFDRWSAIDYFVFPRGLYPAVPPFAIGRFAWDNWLLGDAIRRGIPLVDATFDVLALHQDHDYAHAGGLANAARGEEAARNRALAEGTPLLSIADATHVLRRGKVRPALRPAYYWSGLRRAMRATLARPVPGSTLGRR